MFLFDTLPPKFYFFVSLYAYLFVNVNFLTIIKFSWSATTMENAAVDSALVMKVTLDLHANSVLLV